MLFSFEFTTLQMMTWNLEVCTKHKLCSITQPGLCVTKSGDGLAGLSRTSSEETLSCVEVKTKTRVWLMLLNPQYIFLVFIHKNVAY